MVQTNRNNISMTCHQNFLSFYLSLNYWPKKTFFNIAAADDNDDDSVAAATDDDVVMVMTMMVMDDV